MHMNPHLKWDTLCSGEFFNLQGGVVYGNLNLSRSQPGPITAVTSPSDILLMVIYSLDRRPQTATYSLTAYPPGATGNSLTYHAHAQAEVMQQS